MNYYENKYKDRYNIQRPAARYGQGERDRINKDADFWSGVGQNAGGIGAALGGVGGAILGSVIPGAGTLAGAGLGTALGGGIGQAIGGMATSHADAQRSQVEDDELRQLAYMQMLSDLYRG